MDTQILANLVARQNYVIEACTLVVYKLEDSNIYRVETCHVYNGMIAGSLEMSFLTLEDIETIVEVMSDLNNVYTSEHSKEEWENALKKARQLKDIEDHD